MLFDCNYNFFSFGKFENARLLTSSIKQPVIDNLYRFLRFNIGMTFID
jgi:hypothetical protein